MKKMLTLATTLGLLVGADAARADHCGPRYKTVIVHETKLVPRTVWVVKYDHCDRPFRVAKTVYDAVRVPVEKIVRVY